MKVVLETPIPPHDADLYRPDITHRGIEGFASVTDEALDAYESQGFLVIHGAFSPSEVKAAKDCLHAMVHADDPGCESIYYEGAIRELLGQEGAAERAQAAGPRVDDLALGDVTRQLPAIPPDVRARYVRKFMGFTAQHPPLAALAAHADLLRLIERIVGGPARLFQEMAMIKPPGGREKPWHQDHAYFNLPLTTRIVGVWIALDRVTPENGCMHVLAGGHREGPRIHFMRRDWQLCDTDVRGTPCTALPMEAGDVMIFDAKLPHGTPTNRSGDYRWAVQLHYVPQSAHEVPDDVRLAAFGSEGKDVTC